MKNEGLDHNNSHQAQEEANVSSIGIYDADAIAKLQVQAPTNSLNIPDSDSTSKPVHDNSGCTDNSDLSHHLSHHPCNLRGFSSGISNNCKFMHDPGSIIFSIKDLSVKVMALMCNLHELLVGEPKGVFEGGVFSVTKDDLEGTEVKQSRCLDGLQTKSSLRLDFPLEVLFIYRREP